MLWFLSWQYRYFESELRHLAELVPRDRPAVDVGLSLGTWSWWLARHAPVVHAFEANVDLAAALERSLPKNVRVHRVAVSDRVGEAQLSIPPGDRGPQQRFGCRVLGLQGPLGLDGRASLLPLGGPAVVVPTVTLDSLDLGPVGFVKVDVEGHEPAVIAGATATLARDRPNVVLEIEHQFHEGSSSIDDVFQRMHDNGYEGKFLLKGKWQPIESFDVQAHQIEVRDRVQRSGLLRNTLFNARRYVNNFVFTPG
jgi:FkbM family methyltransferase